MAETVFTFLLMVALALLLWRPDRARWWAAVIAGLLVGVRGDRAHRGRGHARGAPAVPAAARLGVEDAARLAGRDRVRGRLAGPRRGATRPGSTSAPGTTTRPCPPGFYLWGRVSSFADCARIKPTGLEAKVCPTEPLADRHPAGQLRLARAVGARGHGQRRPARLAVHVGQRRPGHAGQQHAADQLRDPRGRGAAARLREDGVLQHHAVVRLPADRLSGCGHDVLLQLPPPLRDDRRTTLLPPDNPDHEWIPGGTAYQDWLSYGHQAPGVVHQVFAAADPGLPAGGVHLRPAARADLPGRPRRPAVGDRREAARRGPRLVAAACPGAAFGPAALRLHWAPRGTTMLPWVTAVALLVFPDRDRRLRLPLPDARPSRSPAWRPAWPSRRAAPPRLARSPASPARQASSPPSPTRSRNPPQGACTGR